MANREALPDKLSALIRVALDDLREIEKDPRYRVNMQLWHTPFTMSNNDKKCAVCLAGAVMARRLYVDPSQKRTPSDFTWEISQKLTALDDIIHGCPTDAHDAVARTRAADNLGKTLSYEAETVLFRYTTQFIPRYADNSEEFFRYFYGMADDLEKVGL